MLHLLPPFVFNRFSKRTLEPFEYKRYTCVKACVFRYLCMFILVCVTVHPMQWLWPFHLKFPEVKRGQCHPIPPPSPTDTHKHTVCGDGIGEKKGGQEWRSARRGGDKQQRRQEEEKTDISFSWWRTNGAPRGTWRGGTRESGGKERWSTQCYGARRLDRQHLLSALCGSGNGWRVGETLRAREGGRHWEEKLGKGRRGWTKESFVPFALRNK